MTHETKPTDAQQAVRELREALGSNERPKSFNTLCEAVITHLEQTQAALEQAKHQRNEAEKSRESQFELNTELFAKLEQAQRELAHWPKKHSRR